MSMFQIDVDLDAFTGVAGFDDGVGAGGGVTARAEAFPFFLAYPIAEYYSINAPRSLLLQQGSELVFALEAN